MTRKTVLLLIGMGWLLQAAAQQDYFVFIQHEKHQPFYVRIGDKVHSSSAVGHVILSRLKDSTYTLVIGFPNNQFPEQEYSVQVNKRDRGFELKNLAEKGWTLFDIHSLQLISPVKNTNANAGGGVSFIKRNDEFARLMSGVVNDTAVLYVAVENKPVVPVTKNADTTSTELTIAPKKTEAPVKETKKAEDTVSVVKITPEPVNDSVFNPPALPVISLVRQYATDTGYYMVVLDEKDSIDIFIPADVKDIAKNDKTGNKTAIGEAKPKTENKSTVTDSGAVNREIAVSRQDNKPVPESKQPVRDSQEKVLDRQGDTIQEKAGNKTEDKPKDTAKDTVQDKPSGQNVLPATDNGLAAKAETASQKPADSVKKQPKLVMMNSDCRSVASDNDVDKLRVKLIREKDAESRLSAARKVFRTRCFTAAQVKALSELFPYDDQKYQFLEAAYPFVSDTYKFKELVSLLSDPTYVQRFRKLVRLD